LLFDQRQAAKSTPREQSGGFSWHSGLLVLRLAHLQMKREFIVEVTFKLPPPQRRE
jgi:hypothetical protein